MTSRKELTILNAVAIFGLATLYFFTLLLLLFPYLKQNFNLNPALYWFITGYCIFIPLFLFAVFSVRKEGNSSFHELLQALNIKKLDKTDWLYSLISIILIFVFTGIIFGVSVLLNKYFGIRLLNTSPSFMEGMKPFVGLEKLLLLVWFPMFFFNIVGEEILWRGYIQSRLKTKYAWIICSLLWAFFHLPFGIDLIIMALPALIIIPYIFYKRPNTLISIIIHGVYNGPIFVMISLGYLN